jgi:hypothetical protein
VNVLVDTSIWSLALRRTARHLDPIAKAQVAELAELINEGRAKMLGIARPELHSGIKSQCQFAKLQEIPRSFSRRASFYRRLRICRFCRQSVPNQRPGPGVVDRLICSVAQSRDWVIFSTDPGFKLYATVPSISLHASRK